MDAGAWDERYAAAAQVWSSGPNQFVVSELADLPPGRAVDLACGEGRNALWLAGRGWSVTGIDFSEVAIDRARRLAGDRAVDWVVGDALTVGLPNVDLALIAYLQLPADQRRTAVRRAFEALEEGGTLFVVAHDSTNLTEGTGGPQDAAVLYTAEDVLDDLVGGRFETIRAERVPRTVSEDDDHGGRQDLTAWDALVRVTRH